MKSIPTVSTGLFGRISSLALPEEQRQQELFDMASYINSRYPSNQQLNSEQLAEKVELFLFFLTKELSVLVEAIVLGDKLALYAAPDNPNPGSHLASVSKSHRAINMPAGWQSIMVYAEEANELQRLVKDGMPCRTIYNSSQTACDVHDVLFHMWHSGRAQSYIVKDKKIDHEMFELVNSAPEFELEREPGYLHYQNPQLLLDGLAKVRGESFEIFEASAMPQLTAVSRFFFRHPSIDGSSTKDSLRLSYAAFLHSLFDELEAGIQNDSILLSNWYSSDYFDRILEANRVKTLNLWDFATSKFNDSLQATIEQNGAAEVGLLLPQIFRFCLHENRTVKEILETALQVRRKPWAKSMRGYLSELLNEKNSLKVARIIPDSISVCVRGFNQRSPSIERRGN